MRRLLFACLLVSVPLAAQEIPMATQLPGSPFSIRKTWVIGGVGNWDYLTIDPAAQRLYIAHGAAVQVVDIDSGQLVAQISGFKEAHSIALDDTGSYAYVSDGQADAVRVVDRQRFEIESTIPIHCSPRSVAFERGSQLVFAICGATAAPPPAPTEPPAHGSTAVPRGQPTSRCNWIYPASPTSSLSMPRQKKPSPTWPSPATFVLRNPMAMVMSTSLSERPIDPGSKMAKQSTRIFPSALRASTRLQSRRTRISKQTRAPTLRLGPTIRFMSIGPATPIHARN